MHSERANGNITESKWYILSNEGNGRPMKKDITLLAGFWGDSFMEHVGLEPGSEKKKLLPRRNDVGSLAKTHFELLLLAVSRGDGRNLKEE